MSYKKASKCFKNLLQNFRGEPAPGENMPPPPSSESTCSSAEISHFFESGSEQPTRTQENNLARAVASARRAQSGEPTPLPKTKEKIADSEEPFDKKIFNLTPEVSSKVLVERQVKGAKRIVEEVRNILWTFGVRFELTDKTNHYLISAKHIEHEWARNFYRSHTKPNKLTIPHGSNKPCTDHYNAVISYLFHYVCLLAENEEPARPTCAYLFRTYERYLDTAKIKELYPKVFSLMFGEEVGESSFEEAENEQLSRQLGLCSH